MLQYGVAALEKDMPFPADCALSWIIWVALNPINTTLLDHQSSGTTCTPMLVTCGHTWQERFKETERCPGLRIDQLTARNIRGDGYGGSRKNRLRLPLEVYTRVREVVGGEYVVGCRYLGDECIDNGSDVEDAKFFAIEFARAGMDFLSVSRGGKFEDAAQPKTGWAAYPYTGPSGYECMPSWISDEQGPYGRNFAPVAAIRAAIRQAGFETPVVVAGGIHGFDQPEAVLV